MPAKPKKKARKLKAANRPSQARTPPLTNDKSIALPPDATPTIVAGRIYGPAWLWGNFPWPSEDLSERRSYAAQLFEGAMTSGESNEYIRAVGNVVSDYLEGQRHFGRFAMHALAIANSRLDGTPEESAMKMGLAAVVELLYSLAVGRPLDKEVVHNFRRAARAVAPHARPYKGARVTEYALFVQRVRNVCDGTREGLRLAVSFAALAFHGNPQSAKVHAAFDEATDELLAAQVMRNGVDLTRTNMQTESFKHVEALANAILRILGVTPPRSGDRKPRD